MRDLIRKAKEHIIKALGGCVADDLKPDVKPYTVMNVEPVKVTVGCMLSEGHDSEDRIRMMLCHKLADKLMDDGFVKFFSREEDCINLFRSYAKTECFAQIKVIGWDEEDA